MSWWEAVSAFLASMGIKFGVAMASCAGGFISLNFFDGTPQHDGTVKPLTCVQRWGIAVTGMCLGTFLAGPVIDFSGITVKGDRVEMGLGMVIGLFGMAVAAQVIKAIRELPLIDFLKSWLPKRG